MQPAGLPETLAGFAGSGFSRVVWPPLGAVGWVGNRPPRLHHALGDLTLTHPQSRDGSAVTVGVYALQSDAATDKQTAKVIA